MSRYRRRPTLGAIPETEVRMPSSFLPGSALRRVAAGFASLLVVLAAVWYVVAPSGIATDLTVREVPLSEAAGDLLLVDYERAAPRYTQVVYGAISAPDDVDVRGVVLTVERRDGTDVARLRIGSRETYRTSVHLVPARYRFVLTARVEGQRRTDAVVRRVRDDRAYEVSLRVKRSGLVTMLPVTSY